MSVAVTWEGLLLAVIALKALGLIAGAAFAMIETTIAEDADQWGPL